MQTRTLSVRRLSANEYCCSPRRGPRVVRSSPLHQRPTAAAVRVSACSKCLPVRHMLKSMIRIGAGTNRGRSLARSARSTVRCCPLQCRRPLRGHRSERIWSRVSYPRVGACLFASLMPAALNVEQIPAGVAVPSFEMESTGLNRRTSPARPVTIVRQASRPFVGTIVA